MILHPSVLFGKVGTGFPMRSTTKQEPRDVLRGKETRNRSEAVQLPDAPVPTLRRDRNHWWAVLCSAAVTICTLPAAQASEAIRIAIAGPVTGPQRFATRSIEAGVRQAIGELSAQSAEQFALSTADDNCDPEIAQAKAREIVAAGTDLVLGHPCAKAAVAAASIYAQAGVVFIATHTRHPALTAKGRGSSIFRLCGRDDSQGADAARILSLRAAGKPVALVHDRTLYAKMIAEQAERGLHAAKLQIISATIIAGHKEYTRLTEKIKDAGAVLFVGFPMEAGFIASELDKAGSSVRLIASDAVASAELAASFPGIVDKIDVLMPAGDNGEAFARAAVEIFTHALSRGFGPFQEHWLSDTATRRALAAAILAKAGPHASSLGPVSFNSAGDAAGVSYRLMRWNGKKWVPARVSP